MSFPVGRDRTQRRYLVHLIPRVQIDPHSGDRRLELEVPDPVEWHVVMPRRSRPGNEVSLTRRVPGVAVDRDANG